MAPQRKRSPLFQALGEQQDLITRLQNALSSQASRHQSELAQRDQHISQLRTVATKQRDQLVSQGGQILALGRGLKVIAEAAGIEGHVRTAMMRTADEQNPANPIPEPPAQPAPQSTQDAKTPEAFGDVQAPGLVPGSTNDVAADATTTVYTPGDDIPGPPLKNLVDVTAPVDGTQGPRPLNEVRTLTDVRVGDPMNPAPAFPLRGDFANGQRLGAKEAASNRTMACLRLARLRINAGLADSDNDFEVATTLETNASLTNEAISHEIATLEGVSKAAAAKQQRPAGLVPRAASAGQRSVPSMQQTAAAQAGQGGEPADTADSDLFM